MSDRLTKLLAMLEKTPADAFLLYAAGFELKKANEHTRAIEFLNRAIAADAQQHYAHYQKGQIYELMGNVPAARKAYAEGLSAAQEHGDAKAAGELESALAMLS